jgi:simple sugar transport system ATP-binding protein
MVGSELPSPSIDEPVNSSSLSLEIENLTIVGDDERKLVDDVSIEVHKGEIVGIAGVEGNGQHELVGSILGTQEVATGRILLSGSDITQTDVRFRRENGLGYIPQDRQHEGLLLTAPLWENAALGYQTQDPFASGLYNLFFNRKGSRAKTSKICNEFDVRTPNIEVAAHALSGGNQQKLLVGKELLSDPTVLIASHPTRGIDVGAQAAIWEQIKSARSNGLATLLISADLDELIGLSDVIVVMFRGKIVAKLDPNNISPRDLGGYMTGSSVQEQRT